MLTREKVIAHLCSGCHLEWHTPIKGRRRERTYLMNKDGSLVGEISKPMLHIFYDAGLLDAGRHTGFEIYQYCLREGLNEGAALQAIERLRAKHGGSFSYYLI